MLEVSPQCVGGTSTVCWGYLHSVLGYLHSVLGVPPQCVGGTSTVCWGYLHSVLGVPPQCVGGTSTVCTFCAFLWMCSSCSNIYITHCILYVFIYSTCTYLILSTYPMILIQLLSCVFCAPYVISMIRT